MPGKIEVKVTRVNEDGTRKELMFRNFEGLLLLGKFTDNAGVDSGTELVDGLSIKDIMSLIASSTNAHKAVQKLIEIKSLSDSFGSVFDIIVGKKA